MLSAENLASIESEGRRLLAAARRDPDRDVPQYPGWMMSDLVSHTASIHGRTTLVCRELPEARVSSPKLPAGEDPFEWYESNLDEMLAALTAADTSTPVWAFGPPHNIGFWERRMVIETGVHRWDAFQALGEEDRLTDVVARLGLDEFDVMWLHHLKGVTPARFTATDLGESWEFGDRGTRLEVEGTASDIYLRLMSRPSNLVLPDDWAAAVDNLAPTPKP